MLRVTGEVVCDTEVKAETADAEPRASKRFLPRYEKIAPSRSRLGTLRRRTLRP
jgi:hypothetical protein